MIAQHYNHPSILLWGLGNEDDWPTEYPEVNQQDIRALFQELNALSHELDPSRFTTMRRCDFARDITDVYSPSIWAGWYRGDIYRISKDSRNRARARQTPLPRRVGRRQPRRPPLRRIPTRFSPRSPPAKAPTSAAWTTSSPADRARVSKDGDWSETYACNLFDWYLKTQETLPWLTGSAQWIFKDFTTPLRVENPVPRINQKGVIERDMTKKEGYFVFQSYWTEAPMVHIYGHSWPIRWGDEGESKMVKVYSNCDTAELFVNGKIRRREASQQPGLPCRRSALDDALCAREKSSCASSPLKDGKTVTDEIDFLYQTEKWGAPAELKLSETIRGTADGKEIVTVEARLYDAKGKSCLDARNQVRFTIAGAGTLIDNQRHVPTAPAWCRCTTAAQRYRL